MPTAHYRALVAKADGFFARVHLRHADAMDCDAGCSDCCQAGLTVTGVEAAAIRAHLAGLSHEERASLRTSPRADGCAALDAEGRCRIYAARPLVCRTHGVPVRVEGVVSACPRNFRGGMPDGDAVLEQATMSTLLAAVDAAHGPSERVAIETLLRER